MRNFTFLYLLASLASNIRNSESSCVPRFGACDEDCDCCGNDVDKDIKCEIRRKVAGRRCYVSGSPGHECYDHNDCKSQRCNFLTNRCIPFPRPIHPADICPITFETTLAIDGQHPDFPEECADLCSVSPPGMSVSFAVDGDLGTAYANERALTSGLLLYPESNAPITELELCSASSCPECDPTCYKLEGYCSDDDTYELVQDGPISFTARGECIKFPVTERSFYSHYKLTFPCQGAEAPKCPKEVPGECSCKNGLTPYVPEPKVDTAECAGMTAGVGNNAPLLEYVGSSKVGEYTHIVYSVKNPGNGVGRKASQYFFKYFVLPWKNECCFDCFDAFIDNNRNKIVDPEAGDEICTSSCDSTRALQYRLLTTEDTNLCMTGYKIDNPAVVRSQQYLFQVTVYGDVTMETQTIGVFYTGKIGGINYQQLPAPVCNCEGTTLEGQCLAHPMQIAEVKMKGKCNQLSMY